MNLLELVDNRDLKIKELENFTEVSKKEFRKLNDNENSEFLNLKNEIERMNKEIEDIKEADKKSLRSEPSIKNNLKNMNENFSLLRAIDARANGRPFDEKMLSYINVGKEEMRKSSLPFSGDIQLPVNYRANIVAGSDGAGQDFISEDKLGLIAPLRNRLVLVQAGATFMTGLKGDISIPYYAGTTASWKGEVVTAVDGAGATSEVTMSPKRLTCYIDVSKQFLNQDTVDAEAMLLNDIVYAISDKLESTIFSGAAGSSTQPAGFFVTPSSTISGTTSWSNVVALETGVGASNVNYTTAAYITSAKGRGKLKSTAKSSNAGIFCLEGSEMNGYPVLVTNSVIDTINGATAYTGGTAAGIVFGDWSQFVIGQWGAIDLIVDGTSQALLGNVRIVINAYFDAVQRVSGAFCIGSLA
ncbi:MAG: phage major capsid protein [Bacteroidetes bacterium]|nr:phage major capsid protein [Bacteroidota bacterium]